MRRLVRLAAIGWAAVTSGAAQDTAAAALISETDAAVHRTAALRASGRMTLRITAEGASQTTELSFRAARRHPSEARFELVGAAFPMLTLCWNGILQSYYFLDGEQGGNKTASAQSCVPAELSGHLADGLVSAVDAGYEWVEYEGRAVECRVVRAEYQPAQASVSVAPGSWAILRNMVRTLWIERTRNLVLRSRLEARIAHAGGYAPLEDKYPPDLPALVQTTTYSTIVTLSDLPPEEFSYQPRQNFALVSHAPSLLATLYPKKPATQPAGQPDSLLLYSRDPEYTPKALADRIQGVVTVSATVGADGVPREMRVIRSLDPGLDQKAIECVGAWRFRPGRTAPAMIDVRFRLPPE